MTEEKMITKVIDTEVKEVADRVLEFIGSTEKQDRDGEVIKVDGWDLKNYKKNPIFMWAHDYRSLPIGKTNRVWVEDGSLKFKVEFAPPETYEFADTVYKLYKGGFLKATSVGFVPKEWSDGDSEKTPKRTYNKQELLELSGVPVPSNPEALVQAREQGLITVKEFEAITKPEETDDWIRIPVAECNVTATIDISKEEGIKALYCGKEKKVKTYMFDKRPPYNWTMAKAKKWVEDHKSYLYTSDGTPVLDLTEEDSDKGIKLADDTEDIKATDGVTEDELRKDKFPRKREISQADIIDELDYLIRLIDTEGMNEEVERDAWNLVREVMRLTGGDIPDDILAKVGAVLSQKNRDNLTGAQNLIQRVLDSARPEQESIEPVPVKPSVEEVAEAVVKAVKAQIDRMQGKVS